MPIIEVLEWGKIVQKILNAIDRVIVIMPGISESLCEVLTTSKAKISICINNEEAAFRNGYSDKKAIEILMEAGVTIKQANSNRVSFLVFDKEGYIYFPESRIFTDILKSEGFNAIKLDPITQESLILHFFPLSSGNRIKPISEKFNIDTFAGIQNLLSKNPPLQPDLQRQIKTYTSRFQMVEFSFTGANLDKKKVPLPKRVLPYVDEILEGIIASTLELFNKLDFEKEIPEYRLLIKGVKQLRKDFLCPLTCRERKNILEIKHRKEFTSSVKELIENLPEIKKAVELFVKSQRIKVIALLKIELLRYYKQSPPPIPLHKKEMNHDEFIDDYISGVIVMIPFPTGKEIVESIQLTAYYYDFTWEDFSDKVLLKEIRHKQIISGSDYNQIVSIRDAFQVKP